MRNQTNNYLFGAREVRRLLYNTGRPQYNPEVSHGYIGSLASVLIGLVENFLSGLPCASMDNAFRDMADERGLA